MRQIVFALVAVGLVAVEGGSASAQQCVPPCREGYTCLQGQCVSACNPPCAANELCTSAGECVSKCNPPCAAGATCTASGQCQAPQAQQAPPAGTGYQGPPSGPPSSQPPPSNTAGEGAPPAQSFDQPMESPGFSFLFRFGPTLGWYAGGHVEIGFAIRLHDGLYLVPSLRAGGGVGFDTGDEGNISFVVGGGGLDLRFLHWASVGGVGQFGVGVTYMGETEYHEDGIDYGYVAPHVRAGGGIIFASSGRFAWGIEATARLGYAINTYNFALDEGLYWAEDYSGFYGAFDASLVLTF